jgi:hypothetical protein
MDARTKSAVEIGQNQDHNHVDIQPHSIDFSVCHNIRR